MQVSFGDLEQYGRFSSFQIKTEFFYSKKMLHTKDRDLFLPTQHLSTTITSSSC